MSEEKDQRVDMAKHKLSNNLVWCSVCGGFGLPATRTYVDPHGVKARGLCTDCGNVLRNNTAYCKTKDNWAIEAIRPDGWRADHIPVCEVCSKSFVPREPQLELQGEAFWLCPTCREVHRLSLLMALTNSKEHNDVIEENEEKDGRQDQST